MNIENYFVTQQQSQLSQIIHLKFAISATVYSDKQYPPADTSQYLSVYSQSIYSQHYQLTHVWRPQ